MKIKIVAIFVVVLVLMSCSKFWENSLTGPIVLSEQGDHIVSLVLSKSIPDSTYFKSNMFLNSDSSGTVFQTVQLIDSVMTFSTLVSDNDTYKGRISSNGIVYFSDFTIGGISPTHWTMHELQGPWFWGDVDLEGNFVQSLDNLADTVVIPIKVYAPPGNYYYFNGSGTDFENRAILWNVEQNYYGVDMTTLPGVHQYDWWDLSIDSVRFGNITIYDITGGYIRFEVVDSTHVTLLDSLSSTYAVSWFDTTSVDSVELMISDQLGDRSYSIINQLGEWTRDIVISSDTLIYARLEADGVGKYTNFIIEGEELHHLTERDSSQYWFEFRLINNVVVQDSNNVIIAININP